MYIQRKLEKTIRKYLNTPEIIAIIGPRQSGKTTLMRHIYETLTGAIFLTFEDQKTLSLFDTGIDEFIKIYVKPYQYVFIDEFQYARKGGKSLKYIYDTQKTKIIISGSSAIDITVKTLKHLVGRIFIFSLLPLDFGEFLLHKNAPLHQNYKKWQYPIENPRKKMKHSMHPSIFELFQELYEEYIIFGGYPRVLLARDTEEKEQVLKNIYNTYFLRDVKDLLGLIDDYRLANLIKGLALQIGNMINYQELSKLSELSFPTLKKYLNFLEKTYISMRIRPFFENKRSEIVKNPKIYFFDTGLRNYIVNDFRKIKERPDGGALLENAFFMQCIKKEITPKYWRSKMQHEIDFVLLLKRNKILAVEIKKYRSFKTESRTAMRHFLEKYKNAIQLMLYFDDSHKENKDRKIPSLPLMVI